jgi:hypothetical protein
MKAPITLALGLMTLFSAAQFNWTYNINGNTDRLNPSFVIVNSQNEAISVSNGSDGQSNYFILTKTTSNGPVKCNCIIRPGSSSEGFIHVEALHETLDNDVIVGGYYYKDVQNIVEQPFLAKFDNNGTLQWFKIYDVNQKQIVRSNINKVSLCRVHDEDREAYFFVVSGDSDHNPGVEVATNVLKVDGGGNLMFSHKYYDVNPINLRDIREYPGDIEFSERHKQYLITGHREHAKNGTYEELMYYFAIDRNGVVYNSGNYTTLASKSKPIDQDMIYSKDKDNFPTVFTHENNQYVSGVQSLIGYIKMDINLNFSSPKMIWHNNGVSHNGRSISHSDRNGEYYLGVGIFDPFSTSTHNPALQRVQNDGTPIGYFMRYNVKDDVYFGHHTMSAITNELVLVNEHKTDLREIWTDPNGKACGMKEYEHKYDTYTPQQVFYRYDYKTQGKQRNYKPKQECFNPEYRKCENDASHYRTTGIRQWNMDNENIALYPSVLNSQQSYLTLENNTGSDVKVEVRNIAGQLIFNAEQIGAGKNEINLGTNGNLATGIYLVNIFNTQGQLSNSTKIIINQ